MTESIEAWAARIAATLPPFTAEEAADVGRVAAMLDARRRGEPCASRVVRPTPEATATSRQIGNRRRRHMPSMQKIAAFHGLGITPMCVRCGSQPPVATWREAQSWLQRAHIIDRIADGLDLETNLAPLCERCHQSQPMFEPGDEPQALEWFGLPVARSEKTR